MKIKKSNQKKILSALFISVFGFILLNLAFLFVAGFVNGSLALYKLITSKQLEINNNIFFGHVFLIISILIILIISLFILKSKKIKTLYKATYFMVPLAVVYVIFGMFLSNFTVLLYIISALIFFSVLYYLHRNKQSWLYYYSLIFISIIMLIMNILKIDI